MATERLQVFWGPALVGHLVQEESGRLAFVYTAGWLDKQDAQPISLSLPLQTEAHAERPTRAFFAGLLPEGDVRAAIGRYLHINERNDFALLNELGGDCAGALALLPDHQAPPDPNAWSYRTLAREELPALLHRLRRQPLLAGEGLRLSLGGAQNKLPVAVIDGQLAIPENGAPSSHILKPDHVEFRGLVVNEHFCLRLASDCGLTAANSTLHVQDDHVYLLVARYDRETADGRWRRLHQEDFAQALGFPPETKYEAEGGPGFADCVTLLRDHARVPARAVPAFLDLFIFNVLVGNYDAHGKNYALLHVHRKAEFAPAYDIIDLSLYPDLSQRLAMRISGHDDLRYIAPRHWADMGEAAGIAWGLLRDRLRVMAQRMHDQAPETAAALGEAQPEFASTFTRVAASIRARVDRFRDYDQ